MKTKKLLFDNKYPYFTDIDLAKNHIPEWYKKAKRFINDRPSFYPQPTNTVKTCVPFLDAYVSGYMILLQGDLIIEKLADGNMHLSQGSESLASPRPSEGQHGLKAPIGYYENHFAWNFMQAIQIPKKYSLLVTHPLNHFNLPFITMSGVVDDVLGAGDLPFFVRTGCVGIIPKGTPIAQVIPFKQDNWIKVKKEGLLDKLQNDTNGFRMVLSGGYKKLRWTRKEYK